MKFFAPIQTGMKSEKIRNGVSRVRSHRQRGTGRLLRERERSLAHNLNENTWVPWPCQERRTRGENERARGKARDTHMQQGLADKRRELVLTLAPSSAACSLVPGWVSPLPFSRYLKTTLYYLLFCRVNCQCWYVCIKWTNHRGGKNDIWLSWKVQKTLKNGDAIKLTRRVFWCFIRVICCYISIYLIKFQHQNSTEITCVGHS